MSEFVPPPPPDKKASRGDALVNVAGKLVRHGSVLPAPGCCGKLVVKHAACLLQSAFDGGLGKLQRAGDARSRHRLEVMHDDDLPVLWRQ